MASLASILGGGLLTGLAFPLGNKIMDLIWGSGSAELKRHDLKMEKIQADQAAWVRKVQKKDEWYQKERERKQKAGEDLKEFDKAMIDYYVATMNSFPKDTDYYQPSPQQQHSEILITLGGVALIGFIVYKYV